MFGNGDIVQLKSGSPPMTVVRSQVHACDSVVVVCECVWHTPQGESMSGTFLESMLTEYQQTKEPSEN